MARPGRPKRSPPGSRPPFSWIGGALCLDFVNTVTWLAPGELTNERLRSPNDLVDWAHAVGLTSVDLPEDPPADGDERILETAHELRLLLHTVLLDAAARRTPVLRDVSKLTEWVRWAFSHMQLAPKSETGTWAWMPTVEFASAGLSAVTLASVALSAVDLLRSAELGSLRLCANERCGWLFLDRSRKGNRRWCEMRECGARAKARRYRSRQVSDSGKSADS